MRKGQSSNLLDNKFYNRLEAIAINPYLKGPEGPQGPQVIGCWKDSCVQKTKKIEFGKKRGIYYYNKFGNKQYIK